MESLTGRIKKQKIRGDIKYKNTNRKRLYRKEIAIGIIKKKNENAKL
jgi:hypothetical protein